jgi:predicted nuclease with TOPRIM domain
MEQLAEVQSQGSRVLRNIDLGRNPIADAQREYEILAEYYETRTREFEEAVKLNNAMAADVDAKNREIDRLATQVRKQEERLRLLQGFSVALVTRLDTVSEIIATAKREAWEQARKLGLATEPGVDGQNVDLAHRLPPNHLQSE